MAIRPRSPVADPPPLTLGRSTLGREEGDRSLRGSWTGPKWVPLRRGSGPEGDGEEEEVVEEEEKERVEAADTCAGEGDAGVPGEEITHQPGTPSRGESLESGSRGKEEFGSLSVTCPVLLPRHGGWEESLGVRKQQTYLYLFGHKKIF